MGIMKLISHRGNINGPNPKRENTLPYIMEALHSGYGVEIDVWLVGDDIILGHDAPHELVDDKFLRTEGLLCHAKNKEAFAYMLGIEQIHCFWHQEDTYTLTSKGIPVVYPNCPPLPNSIVMDRVKGINEELLNLKYNISVCSDYIETYRTASWL
jgi:hypothetical protein